MTDEHSAFAFADDAADARFAGPAFRCRIPAGVSSRDELLQSLAEGLWTPDDFGFDWDALGRRLRDLSWTPDLRIMLIHAALPRLSEADLATYLRVLREAALWWRNGTRAILAVFPESERARVNRALARTRPGVN